MSSLKIRNGDRPTGKKRRHVDKMEALKKRKEMFRLIEREHQREKDRALCVPIPTEMVEEEKGLV